MANNDQKMVDGSIENGTWKFRRLKRSYNNFVKKCGNAIKNHGKHLEVKSEWKRRGTSMNDDVQHEVESLREKLMTLQKKYA